MFARLASLFSPSPASAVPAKRVAFVITSRVDRATARKWGGRDYWKG